MIRIAAILNVTPDSFFDGGRSLARDAAIQRGLALRAEGADWVDVGGESTRPGAAPVSVEEELQRVLPVVRGLVAAGCPVSVDTSKASVAEAALEAGAEVINDVTALGDPRMATVAARYGAGLVLMHMRGTPATMQQNTRYSDVVSEVRQHLAERIDRARGAGVSRIWADPGLGFGKGTPENLALLRRLGELRSLGVPLYVGASRKRFVGELSGCPDPADRLLGSLGAAAAAVAGGAEVLRVHDVAATRQLLAVFTAAMGPS